MIDALLDLVLRAVVTTAIVWVVMSLAFHVPLLPRRQRNRGDRR